MPDYEPEAILLATGTELGEEWALCVDEHGHGLYLPSGTLHEILQGVPAGSPFTPDARIWSRGKGRTFLGDPAAAFLGALASHTP